MARAGTSRTSRWTRRRPEIELPDWALDDVRAEAEANVARLRTSGVQIAATSTGLAVMPASRGADLPQADGDPAVAATFAVGVMIATGMALPGPAKTREDMSTIATSALRGYPCAAPSPR